MVFLKLFIHIKTMLLLHNKPPQTRWHKKTTILLYWSIPGFRYSWRAQQGWLPHSMISGSLAQNTWMWGGGNHLKVHWVPCLVPRQGELEDRLLSTAPTHGLSTWHGFLAAWQPFTWWLWALGLSVLVDEEKAVSSFLLSLGNHSVTFAVHSQEEKANPHLLMGGMWL